MSIISLKNKQWVKKLLHVFYIFKILPTRLERKWTGKKKTKNQILFGVYWHRRFLAFVLCWQHWAELIQTQETMIYSVGEEERETDAIHLDLCKIFDSVQHNNFVSKLERHGLGGWTTQRTRNCQDGCTQRVWEKWHSSGVCIVTRAV